MKRTINLSIVLFVIVAASIAFFTSWAVLEICKPAVPAVTTQFPNRVQEVLPSVVHIMCDRWQGSGVALTEDIIVTARHIVDGLDYIITMSDGTTVKGIQAIFHKDYDIGFIRVEKKVLTPAKFGSVKDCVLGEPLFVIGSMAGEINFNSISLGIVSGLNRGGDWRDETGKDYGWSILLQTDAEGMGGNSGCPVFTMDGIVRGIWVGSIPPAVHYCIPVDVFLNDIENIKLLFAFEKYKIEEETYSEWDGYNQCQRKNTEN